ncbi:MAG: SPOR domain-containing protein [Melioribacteraceae bacterium]|nr:SPOR domain-containing protein [Melioribacteraceae bacterium]MCO6473648.1 SPOR domain-containing protein [Melioribacteraceae bacterium]MDD3557706.1 SPOR domain-containing protein [Melioribacteraceae bacterium]
MKNSTITLLLFLMITAISCSSSEESTTEDSSKQDIYVFDDISNYEIETVDEGQDSDTDEMGKSTGNFIVQVGAFSSEERAKRFVLENQTKTDWKMSISFSTTVRLYVVQLPPFTTRTEAEKVRNLLWQNDAFRDAFIITVE